MFGYFRPYNAKLSGNELRLFNAHYCRCCYCLRIIGGQKARFCTTYDAAVYSLILSLQSQENVPPSLPCERIGKKNLKLFRDDKFGLKLARLSLISVGEKFRDDLLDGDGKKTKIASRILAKAIASARQAEPLLAENSFNGTEKINRLQKSGAPLREVVSAYADMAIGSFSAFMPLTAQTERLIRCVSEWNILTDMICDYDDDYKNGSYNGLKVDGLPTFSEYFNSNYVYFLSIVNSLNEELLSALKAVQDNSTAWNTLYKIITSAIDNVLPAFIKGKDVKFHYFQDLYRRHKQNVRIKKESKRLGVKIP